MADDDDDEDDDVDDEEDEDGEDEDGEGKPSKGGGKGKLFAIIGVVVVLLLGGGGGAAYYFGLLDSVLGDASDAGGGQAGGGAAGGGPGGGGAFHPLPELLIDLKKTSRRKHIVKVRFSLEVGVLKEEDIQHLDQITPPVVDRFQNRVREMSVDQLRGAAGAYILREAMLAEVVPAARPIRVHDVVITELLVQ